MIEMQKEIRDNSCENDIELVMDEKGELQFYCKFYEVAMKYNSDLIRHIWTSKHLDNVPIGDRCTNNEFFEQLVELLITRKCEPLFTKL